MGEIRDIRATARNLRAIGARPRPSEQITREAHQQARREYLEVIRHLDSEYRAEVAAMQTTMADRPTWEQERLEWEAAGLLVHQDIDLFISRRILTWAVESYLLECVASTWLTGKDFLERATSTDDLVATLQQEEDRLIAIHGAPWD